ncbi:hypothetical protein EG329_010544 [Mollisiaceae sp. DMI_Dod_QoI]|nr:hypothetical protein EG329_010544 [Helotiales sp. DMI_Dod_QoI]
MTGLRGGSTSQRPPKPSTKARNDQRWERHKDNIRIVYMDMNHSLKETMEIIKNIYHFKARSVRVRFTNSSPLMPVSERKWKEKLKSWKFEKNIPSTAMSILVAKSEKRKMEQGKETQFFYCGAEIRPEKLENFKKRKTTEVMDILSPAAETPAGINYCTPTPGSPLLPPVMGDPPTLNQQDVQVNQLNLVHTHDLQDSNHITIEFLPDTGSIAEAEPQNFLPDPSHGSGERNMLIQTISTGSMLWNCPGRGLHTIDEESVIGLDDEIFAPFVASDLIAEHIEGARIDRDNPQIKSSAVKYLGSIILAIERKCCSTEVLVEYLSEFLDLLEAGPGGAVIALRELPDRPVFHVSEYSDICLMYIAILALLRQEFDETSEVVVRTCVLLANLKTLYPEMLFHAEILYGVAIEGYEKMGNSDDLLQCQLSLADVLLDLNRSSDAYELVARSCSRYLHENLDGWVGKLPTMTHYSLASLSLTSPGVRPSIFRIKCVLSRRSRNSTGGTENDYLYIVMIHEIVTLGGIISIKASQSDLVLYLEALDPLWSEIFNKLSLLDDINFAFLKAFAYLQRSNYLCNGFNLFRHLNCLEDIRVAHRYLSNGRHFQPYLKNHFVRHVESLRLRAMNIPQLSTLDMMDAFSTAGLSNVPQNSSDDRVSALLETPTPPADAAALNPFGLP